MELVIRSGIHTRAVARSKNPGGLVVLGGKNMPPLVDIGLADLPKTGGLATGLTCIFNTSTKNDEKRA